MTADAVKNVLIVDDERPVLSILDILFKRCGCMPHCSLSGQKGLELMQEHRIRVIFTDLRMPNMDGIEFCRLAKKIDPHAHIFAISAYINAYSPEELLDTGFKAWFGKPYRVDDLLETCMKAFAELLPDDEYPEEKRRNPRAVQSGKTVITVLSCSADSGLVGRTFLCYGSSISERGTQILADREIRVGTNLGLHICTTGVDKPFVMNTTVRWSKCLEESNAAGKTFRAGVEFLDSSPDLESWREYLAREFHMLEDRHG